MVHWHFYVYFGKEKTLWIMTDLWDSIPVWIFVFLLLLFKCAFPLKIFYWEFQKWKQFFPFYFQLFWNVWLLTRCPKQHRTHVPQCPRMKIWPTPPLNISKKNLKRNMKKHRKNKQRRKKNSLTFLLLKKKKNFSSSYSHQFFSLFKKKFQEDSTSFHNLIYKKFF